MKSVQVDFCVVAYDEDRKANWEAMKLSPGERRRARFRTTMKSVNAEIDGLQISLMTGPN